MAKKQETKQLIITGEMLKNMAYYLNEYFMIDLAENNFKNDFDKIMAQKEQIHAAINNHMKTFTVELQSSAFLKIPDKQLGSPRFFRPF